MQAPDELEIREARLDDEADAEALLTILDEYARGPEGQGAPIDEAVLPRIVPGLLGTPGAIVLLATLDGAIVGAAVCQHGFSSFAAKPLLNVHDLAVRPGHRGRGIGRALLDEAERRARGEGCCRLTLEVHDGNERAKALYRSFGFGEWESPTLFVSKKLAG